MMESDVATTIRAEPDDHPPEKLGFHCTDQPSLPIDDQFESLSIQDNHRTISNCDSREGDFENVEDDCIYDVNHVVEAYGIDSDVGEYEDYQLAADEVDDMTDWEAYNYCDSRDEGEDEKRAEDNENFYVWSEDELEQDNLVEVLEVEKGNMKSNDGFKFPIRPGAENCSYYMRTGGCKYEMSCRFNHPHDRKSQEMEKGRENGTRSAEKANLSVCKFYDRPGGCKFGEACKFNHIKQTTAVSALETLNSLGLPIRAGEKACSYYMRNGCCKFGKLCKFDHPEDVGRFEPFAAFNRGRSLTSQALLQQHISSSAALNNNISLLPFIFPTQGVSTSQEWKANPSAIMSHEGNMMPPYVVKSHRQEASSCMQQIPADYFPERPGVQECSHFLKTGKCKYGSSCKFHHSKSRMLEGPPYALSELGLPLRRGEAICSYYSRYGICKFGPACKYDHPLNNPLVAPMSIQGSKPLSIHGSEQLHSWSDDEADCGALCEQHEN